MFRHLQSSRIRTKTYRICYGFWVWLGKIPGIIPAESRTLIPLLRKPVPSKAGTVNPLLSPRGGLFISNPFEGGLIETGGLFNLEKTMLSVLHKKPRIQSRNVQVEEFGGHAADDQKQIRTSSW